MIKLFCEWCGDFQPIICKVEQHKDGIWGDILCKKCHLVLNTLETDEPGEYIITKANIPNH